MSWSRPFPDPIPTKGKPILTLKQAADYIKRLSKAEQEAEHWQLAIAQLIEAAEGRSFLMFADIGMRRALNYGRLSPEVGRKRVRVMRILR